MVVSRYAFRGSVLEDVGTISAQTMDFVLAQQARIGPRVLS
jgi:hypothetical protein